MLETVGVLIAAGGLYDLATPRLPRNLVAICAGNARAETLARELLRALGGALIAIGVTVTMLVGMCGPSPSHFVLVIVLVLVLPAEGANAFGMYRVRSPFYFPLAFLLLTLAGVLLSWHAAH
jgi:hypothetical protein